MKLESGIPQFSLQQHIPTNETFWHVHLQTTLIKSWHQKMLNHCFQFAGFEK
jgi:hypothetical protein